MAIYSDTRQGRQQRSEDQLGDILTLGLGDFRGQRARETAADILQGVQTPTFDAEAKFRGPDYAGDFNPTMYATPEAAQYQTAQDSAEGRAAQLDALRALGEQSDQAVGSQQQLDRAQAMQDAAQFAQGREGMIRQDAARRGQIGGAADMVMRAQAAQDAANRNQMGGLQSAQMAALQRLSGTQAQAGLAGQLRGQDQNLAMNNADIINRFNLYNTGARNQANAANTELRNNAGMRNLDAFQQILSGRADASNQNIRRGDELAQRGFDNAMTRAGAIGNAMGGMANAATAQGAAQRQTAGDIAQAALKFFGAGKK